MTELQKYEIVNSAESLDQLSTAILFINDSNGDIRGRNRMFNGVKMAAMCYQVPKLPYSVLTRNYGIRQQAMYIVHYEELES